MRILRTLLLAALAAAAAMALTAGNAAAQHNVHVEVEDGAGCNPCNIHAESIIAETVLINHAVGPVSQCHDEFEGEVYESGEGHITDQELTGPNCNVEPCTVPPHPSGINREWPVELSETTAGEQVEVTFCITPRDSDHESETFCHIVFPVVDEGTHHYIINPQRIHTPCENLPGLEVEGSWEISKDHPGHDNIEVVHPWPAE